MEDRLTWRRPPETTTPSQHSPGRTHRASKQINYRFKLKNKRPMVMLSVMNISRSSRSRRYLSSSLRMLYKHGETHSSP